MSVRIPPFPPPFSPNASSRARRRRPQPAGGARVGISSLCVSFFFRTSGAWVVGSLLVRLLGRARAFIPFLRHFRSVRVLCLIHRCSRIFLLALSFFSPPVTLHLVFILVPCGLPVCAVYTIIYNMWSTGFYTRYVAVCFFRVLLCWPTVQLPPLTRFFRACCWVPLFVSVSDYVVGCISYHT